VFVNLNGDLVRQDRLKINITQAKAAEGCGIDFATYKNAEAGKRIEIESAKPIANFYGRDDWKEYIEPKQGGDRAAVNDEHDETIDETELRSFTPRIGFRFVGEVVGDQPPTPVREVPEANVPAASIGVEQLTATARAADELEGQGLHFMPDRVPVLSDTTLRYLAIVDVVGLAGCFFARTPSALSVNAGYILVFGPILLCLASAWVAFLGHRATGHWQRADLYLAGILFSLPILTSAFLALQFFLLLAPPGECPTFLRWRYLTDFSVEAVKPEYCMGLDPQVQAYGPWLMSPVVNKHRSGTPTRMIAML
jgi:transcriptional regulator with XRE-family HTH domain